MHPLPSKHKIPRRAAVRLVAAGLWLGFAVTTAALAQDDAAPQAQPCPKAVPEGTRCHVLRDKAGAFVWFAIPKDWNRMLVVHAHGGPDLGAADPKRSFEDLQRWAVMTKAGYAWVGSSYRRGGYGVTMAGEDTERARALFVEHFGAPRRTLLHGQSWGGNVAAKTAELYATSAKGRSPFDGLLLTNGVLGGGTRSYDFRLDLRVIYQYVCRNHPLPDEPQYPLWMGLPKDAKLTRAELARRVDACTGARTPAAQRSERQLANLATILNVVKVPERTLGSHLNWATWLFQDVVQERLGGRNPFGNEGVKYSGSSDDAALNAGVLRYSADAAALAQLAQDSDLTGRVNVPTVSLHAIDDPTAFVELDAHYAQVRERAGTADLLVQNFSDEAEHSYLSEPQYPALLSALVEWIDKGVKPTPQSIAERCKGYEAAYANTCRLLPDYRPAPLEARSPARKRK